MKRSAFVAGAAAAVFPVRARARVDELHDVVQQIAAESSGVVGAYARRLGAPEPVLSYNSEERFPAASTIKLLILVTLYQEVERNPALLARRVRLRPFEMVGGSEYLGGAHAGDSYRVDYLAKAMIVASDNTAANALITLLGFDRINATARYAHLARTRLRRHFLDYSAIVKHHENQTTPHDIGGLLYHIEEGAHEALTTLVSPRSCRAMLNLLYHQEDREMIARGLPKGTPVANKTGEVDGVRNDIAIVDPYGDAPYVLTVLTKHLSDYGEGIVTVRRITKAVNAALSRA